MTFNIVSRFFDFHSILGIDFADETDGTGDFGVGEGTSMRYQRLFCSIVGLGLAAMSGCQTWVPEAALTLPSPNYLQHPPQYIPPSPPYPLPRELKSLTDAAAAQPVVRPGPGF